MKVTYWTVRWTQQIRKRKDKEGRVRRISWDTKEMDEMKGKEGRKDEE